MVFVKNVLNILIFSLLSVAAFAQDGHHSEEHQAHEPHAAEAHSDHAAHDGPCGAHHDDKFNPGATAIHHIADANAIHIYGDLFFHLPVILWDESGFKFMTSAAFKAHHHGNGEVAIDRYVLNHGTVNRIADVSFPGGEQAVDCYIEKKVKNADGKEVEALFAVAGGQEYILEKKTSFDGGLMGGGITSYWDLSITRNVFTMLLTCLVLFFMLRSVANSYAKRDGKAPKGMQSFFEPIVEFVRDEVARPLIGEHKYEKFLPYLLSVFFFILGLNLFGQIPFFPGSGNVTGSLSVTMVLAIITFLLTNLNGNKHYWGHTLWMPGVPAILKILIITPVEILGLFLKPFTLMLRLFANVTAGHIVILSFVSIIFIFGGAGAHTDGTVLGSSVGALLSVPLTLFMMAMELLVAFLQAFIFTMLSAVYIGMAVEEAH